MIRVPADRGDAVCLSAHAGESRAQARLRVAAGLLDRLEGVHGGVVLVGSPAGCDNEAMLKAFATVATERKLEMATIWADRHERDIPVSFLERIDGQVDWLDSKGREALR